MQAFVEWLMLVMSAFGVIAAAKQFLQRGANLGLWG